MVTGYEGEPARSVPADPCKALPREGEVITNTAVLRCHRSENSIHPATSMSFHGRPWPVGSGGRQLTDICRSSVTWVKQEPKRLDSVQQSTNFCRSPSHDTSRNSSKGPARGASAVSPPFNVFHRQFFLPECCTSAPLAARWAPPT